MIEFSEAVGIEVSHPLILRGDREQELVEHLQNFRVDTLDYRRRGGFFIKIIDALNLDKETPRKEIAIPAGHIAVALAEDYYELRQYNLTRRPKSLESRKNNVISLEFSNVDLLQASRSVALSLMKENGVPTGKVKKFDPHMPLGEKKGSREEKSARRLVEDKTFVKGVKKIIGERITVGPAIITARYPDGRDGSMFIDPEVLTDLNRPLVSVEEFDPLDEFEKLELSARMGAH